MEKSENVKVVITSVEEKDGRVSVKGSAVGLGAHRVEIMVNGDFNQRYVADNDCDGNWVCEFPLNCNGEYRIEASVRDYSDFSKLRQPVPDENYLVLDGVFVWGSTVVKHSDGLYYMIFAAWDEEVTFNNWHRYSELKYAVSTKLFGPYVYMGGALDRSHDNIVGCKAPNWGNGVINVFHNPYLMHSKKDGKYYLYFMGTTTADCALSGRRQRIGVAVADHPAGPWRVSEKPVIDVREGYHDAVFVNNPSVVEIEEDGKYRYLGIYRANNPPVKVGGYATAEHPEGPFKQSEEPIMVNKDADFAVEDFCLWQNGGKFYCLAKDMSKGDLTGYRDGYSYALFESEDGEDWKLSKNNMAFPAVIPWESGEQVVARLERTGLYIENEVPLMMTNAVRTTMPSEHTGTFTSNIQTPLIGVELTKDEYLLKVGDLEEKSVDKSELCRLVKAAEAKKREDCKLDSWRKLLCALRAGKILLGRESAEQYDVDFAVNCLKNIL